jgi:ketosteroid isomerase-like protein
MKKFIICSIVLCFTVGASAQNNDEMFIRNAMNEQLNAWNGGNLERFMDTYWHSDSLMFIGKNGPTYGWNNTLLNYKKSYPDTAAMGKLDFTILSIKRLSVLYFSVAGKWHLSRTAGDAGGAFTLLFKKIKNKWVIIQDHSS